MSELVPMEVQVSTATVSGDFGLYKVVLIVDLEGRDFGHHITVRPGDNYKRWFSGYLPKNLDELEALPGWENGFTGNVRTHNEMIVSRELRAWIKRALEIAEAMNVKEGYSA